jgi:hypothetical protein
MFRGARVFRILGRRKKKKDTYLIDMLLGTERINLV